MSQFPADWRAQIRAQYLALGSAPADADAIIDLAIHACDKAMDSLGLVLNSAPSKDVGFNAIPLALQLLAMRAEGCGSMVLDTIDASNVGRTGEVTLQMGGKGTVQ